MSDARSERSPQCPGCGYDLSGQFDESDELYAVATCPECGKMWTLDRATAKPDDPKLGTKRWFAGSASERDMTIALIAVAAIGFVLIVLALIGSL